MGRSLLLAALCCTLAVPAHSQPAPPGPEVRADVSGTLGWAHARFDDTGAHAQWDHGIVHGAVGAGWYWTDHLETEVELFGNGTAEIFAFERVESVAQTTYRSSRIERRSAGLGLSQLFQFFRNAWFHPYVGAGLDLRRETREEEVEPVVAFDNVTQRPVTIEPARRIGPTSALAARAFAIGGLKAYLSQRALFRSDLRIGLDTEAGDVVVRAGFGVDF
jgi:hypothetical protein